MLRVGFIGLGRMGGRMAGRLVETGREVVVHNRSVEATTDLVAAGAQLATSPADLAARSDVVITMLSGPPAVRDVVSGRGGVLRAAAAGVVVVDMSTIGPTVARELALEAAAADVTFLDAPVSGSTAAAEAGTLGCVVGGDADAFDHVRPVLEDLASTVRYVGGPGTGAAVKLSLNLVLASLNQAIAESLALGEAEGVDAATILDCLEMSAVSSPYLKYKRDAILALGAADVAFTIGGLRKDVGLMIDHGRRGGVPLFATGIVDQVLAQAEAAGLGEADLSAVGNLVRSVQKPS